MDRPLECILPALPFTTFSPLLITIYIGVWSRIIHLEATRHAHAGQHVGRVRGGERLQVLLHHHVTNQPAVDGGDAHQNAAIPEAEHPLR